MTTIDLRDQVIKVMLSILIDPISTTDERILAAQILVDMGAV
jgi:hypothetical protein